ncbi:MAG: hypothetical protein ACXWUH_14320 [Burkholderiales bacterium]
MRTTDAEQRWNTDGKWRDLTANQRLAFIGKLMIALLTMGFVYPNILG